MSYTHALVDKGFKAASRILAKTFGDAHHRYTHVFKDGTKQARVESTERVHLHWQNLNEDHHRVRGAPYHGRCWLSVRGNTDGHSKEKLFGLGLEWNLWRPNNLLKMQLDVHPHQDSDVTLSLGVWPVTLYLSLEGMPQVFYKKWQEVYRYSGREIGFYVSRDEDAVMPSVVLHWDIWTNDNEWSPKTPRWRTSHVDLFDALLGPVRSYETVILRKKSVKIPMPEGSYDGTLEMHERRFTRRRWPFTEVLKTARLEVEDGIPHEGKGENSWDCGEDALFGLSCTAKNEADAIGKVIALVLENRRRYDGNIDATYPSPAERRAAREARLAAVPK